jgi:aminoglycoside phosphotransferase (APT) family kinase protein
MIPGSPPEARWIKPKPGALTSHDLERMVRIALPRSRVLAIEPFADGLRHANFKITIDSSPHQIVLRVFEHDPSLCQKELNLMALVRSSVPVAEVIHAEPRGVDGLQPFVVRRYAEGITFHELRRRGNAEATAQAARSAGETLAAIGRNTFPKPGWLGPGPLPGAPLLEGRDAMPRFIDLCLEAPHLGQRVPLDLRDRIHDLVWSYSAQLANCGTQSSLVHGDFNKRNTLVRETEGRWSVAAVLDWEFAVAGSPLADLATFLRYDRASAPQIEPHFSTGFAHAGGNLPGNWRYLAKVIDLVALCESLSRDELPESVTTELVELVRATVERRDPQFS